MGIVKVKTNHHIPGATEPGDGTLVLNRGTVKVDEDPLYFMVARYKGLRIECSDTNLEGLRALVADLQDDDPSAWASITPKVGD